MIDELFQHSSDRFLDPQLRVWNDRLSRPDVQAYLEVEWPPSVVGQTYPEMIVHVCSETDFPESTEPMSWDDELNAVLIERRVRGLDSEHEATRFSLSLRAAFRRTERDFGNGYFNSVFFAVLKGSGLANHPLLSPLVRGLNHLDNAESQEPSQRYLRCYDMIKLVIQAKANELHRNLEYPLDEAKEILVAALVDYIDRRFSVSIRRQRGSL